ncbi:MAG: dihydroorotase [Solirubrobacterales bacterium]|nr:dihydroorotase [Solirubrobacterales bacterium]
MNEVIDGLPDEGAENGGLPAPLVQRPGPEATILIRGAELLDPAAGLEGAHDLLVEDGRISRIADAGSIGAAEGVEVIEAEGFHVFPAFFDPHVHFRTPGQEYKEDLETGTRSAAAGGYAGVIAMANTSPPVSTAEQVEALRDRASHVASVPVGFTATVTRDMKGRELTDMAELRQAGAVAFTDDGLPIASARILRRALQYQAMTGGRIALHEEDPELSGKGVMNEGVVSSELGLRGVPPISESTMIGRDAAIAGYEGGAIQIQHLSAVESIEQVRRAKADGVDITCEVTPHHLCLTDEAVRDLDASKHKMNPPLRTEADRQALIEALKDGTIDCIATDHAPHAVHEKEVPYEAANMGVTGLETAFASVYTELVLPGTISLGLLVEKLGCGGTPFGIDPFTLAEGSRANLCLIDLDAEWVVGEDGYESRSVNSWCAGEKLRGRVLVTLADGQVAYRLRTFSLGVA